MPRAAWIVAAIVVGLWVLYLVAANVLLETRLLRNALDRQPEKLLVDYDSAWSPYPGRVIVKNLSLRFQDSNVQMLLELDRATMSIDLLALRRRTFHLSKLHGDGVSLRFRHKVHHAVGEEGRLEAYPPIPGFADPPLHTDEPHPPIPDDQYRLWTIHIEDVDASLRQLWLMEYRYRGEGSVTGSMFLRPQRTLWVGPSVLVTHDGVLSIDDRALVDGSDTRVEARVDAFDVRVPHGMAVLRQITGRAEMSGEVRSLEPISRTYLRHLPLALDGGAGHLSILAGIDHGLIDRDTRVEWRASDVGVGSGAVSVRGDVGLAGRVEPARGEDATASLVADLTVKRANVTQSKRELLLVQNARASIATANVDVTHTFPLSALKLVVASARAPNLAAIGETLLPGDVRIASGAATASLDASYRGGAANARADVALERVHVVSRDVDVAASGKLSGVASTDDLETAVSFDGSHVALEDVGVRVEDARTDGLSIVADVRESLLRTRGPSAVDARIGTRVTPGDRPLRFGAALASLPKALGDAPAGPDAEADVRVHTRKGTVDVQVLGAKDGDLVGRGRVRKERARKADGAFLLEAGPIRAGVEIAGGKTRVIPFPPRDWLERETR